MEEKKLNIWFDHGLGDVAHFVALLQLYKRRGWDVRVHYESNKLAVWEAGSIPYEARENCQYHHWRYYSQFNKPVADKDGSGNKVFYNLNSECLPYLGHPDEVWEALCQVDMAGTAYNHLQPHHLEDAKRFLDGLPRPIILLHTHGTNLAHSKNLPADRVLQLYRHLLTDTDAGLVLLDWDNRVPMPPSGRIRHVKRDWGHIDVHELAALMKQADLLIGVDSGPFHLSAFTDLPTLGVFHDFYPTCISLPRPNGLTAVMTRNAQSYRPVNKARRKRWNIIEYAGHGDKVPACDIARHAQRMLAPRYGLKAGRDAMMQQFVREWMWGGTGTSQIADRGPTIDFLLQEGARRFERPVVVETGCIRSAEDWGGAGNSSWLLACWTDGRGGKLISVDNDEKNCEFASKEIKEWPDATVVCSDSVDWLKRTDEKIDVLYLDSMDVEMPRHAEHGLDEIQAALPHLSDNALVVFDDTVWGHGGWKGKGAAGVPWMLANGWKLLKSGYQCVLSR